MAAGVEKIIDASLGDAHSLVKNLEGPFDFVFSEADKKWYLLRVRGLFSQDGNVQPECRG